MIQRYLDLSAEITAEERRAGKALITEASKGYAGILNAIRVLHRNSAVMAHLLSSPMDAMLFTHYLRTHSFNALASKIDKAYETKTREELGLAA